MAEVPWRTVEDSDLLHFPDRPRRAAAQHWQEQRQVHSASHCSLFEGKNLAFYFFFSKSLFYITSSVYLEIEK